MNVIEIEKEPTIGIVNVVTKEKGIRRKIRIESTEIVKKEGVNNVKEAEVKISKKTKKSKSNKSKSKYNCKRVRVKAQVHKIKRL